MEEMRAIHLFKLETESQATIAVRGCRLSELCLMFAEELMFNNGSRWSWSIIVNLFSCFFFPPLTYSRANSKPMVL